MRNPTKITLRFRGLPPHTWRNIYSYKPKAFLISFNTLNDIQSIFLYQSRHWVHKIDQKDFHWIEIKLNEWMNQRCLIPNKKKRLHRRKKKRRNGKCSEREAQKLKMTNRKGNKALAPKSIAQNDRNIGICFYDFIFVFSWFFERYCLCRQSSLTFAKLRHQLFETSTNTWMLKLSTIIIDRQ